MSKAEPTDAECPYSNLLSTTDRDPNTYYGELRRRTDGVVWDTGLDGWVLLSYDQCLAVGRDEATFPLPWKSLPGAPSIQGERGLLMLEGEQHHVLHRRMLAHFHTMSRRPWIRREVVEPIVRETVSEFAHLGKAELASAFADRVHLRIMIALLGLPPQSDEVLQAWAGWMLDMARWKEMVRRGVSEETLDVPWVEDGGWTGTRRDVIERAQRSVKEAADLLRPYVVERAGKPEEDLISGVWTIGRTVFDDWSEDDVIAICRSFTSTTFTTGAFLCNTILMALTHPPVVSASEAEREAMLPNLIEESLRLLPPVHVRARVAHKDVSVGPHVVAAGDMVYPVSAAANRDPHRYPDADAVDLGRDAPQDHQSFSVGPRFCVGAPLVRTIGITALRTLFATLPGLRLDATGASPSVSGFNLRPYRPLNVVFDRKETGEIGPT